MATALGLSFQAGAADFGNLTLAWNPVSDPGVAGYNLYYGTASRVYTNMVPVGNTNTVTITGLTPGVTYFLAVTTEAISGLESSYSDEISFTLPNPGPILQQAVMTSGGVNLSATAPPGHTYDVLATEDFLLWRAIGSVTADGSGTFSFTDPDAPQYSSRFYQLHETTYTVPGSLPVLDTITVADAGVQLLVTGQPGHSYEILATPDFQTWGVVGALTVGLGGAGSVLLPPDPNSAFAFYTLRETDFASAQLVAPFTFYSILPGFVEILFEVQAGLNYNFLETGDFSNWTTITSLSFLGSGTAVFSDTFDPGSGPRIYRLDATN